MDGKEGLPVQSTRIRGRLARETLSNVMLQIEDPPDQDGFPVRGRGEFHRIYFRKILGTFQDE